MCESTISPSGARTNTATDWLFSFEYATQASTMALAVSALICILVNVRLAASPDNVTFASGAGLPPCAQALAETNMNTTAHTRILFMTRLLPALGALPINRERAPSQERV